MACINHPSKSDIAEAYGYMQLTLLRIMSPYLSSDNVREPQAMGKFAEFVSIMNRENTVDLNLISSNFPVYDQTSFSSIYSIKTHGISEEKASPQNLNDYVNEFREMIGHGSMGKFEKAAEKLFEGKDLVPVPEDIRKANTINDVCDYLANKSAMQVPSYHVNQVREAVANSLIRNPDSFGLPREAICEQVVQEICSRITGIGGAL